MKRALRARGVKAAIVALGAAGLLVPAAAAVAAFSGSTATAPATFSSAGSYGTTSTWSPYEIRDASDGSESTPPDLLSEDDGTLWYETGSGFPAVFDPARHIDFVFNAPLQPGLAVTNPEFEMHFASELGFNSWLYVQVYRRSTMTLLTSTPVGSPYFVSPTGTTIVQLPLDAFVTTSDIANDLLVRAVVRNDYTGPDDGLLIDMATLTGTTPTGAFSLGRESVVDTASGTADARPWPLVAVDGTRYSPATAWTPAFSGTRYVRYIFPSPLPTGTPVAAVKLHHAFRPAATGEVCYYFDVRSRTGAVLATHGSATTPYSCNATSTVKQDEILLPELVGSDAVNGFQVRFYWRTSGGNQRSQIDRLAVEATY